jgi:site-specific recombinase XerD
MLSQGVKIENVSRMLGHTTVKQTERYAKVLATNIYDEYDKVAKKIETDARQKSDWNGDD